MTEPAPHILALNGGSSSIKFALFRRDSLEQIHAGAVTGTDAPAAIVGRMLAAVAPHLAVAPLAGIVHRVVHGGDLFDRAQRVTPHLMEGLRTLVPLAPNHLPDEIALIEACVAAVPGVPHVACFDTAFHRHLPPVSRTLPVPPTEGLRRYGFHGLSYAFLLSALQEVAGDEARGRVVLAHLGSGASLAAIAGGHCIDTTMGLTPTGGLVMSRRSGDLDPGVVACLARQRHLSIDQVQHLLTHDSGLLGISGFSADMQELLAHERSDPRARLAVDIFCYQVRKGIGAFAAALGGVETLVFSGGIGEHAPVVRQRICTDLAFLNLHLDERANATGAAVISTPASGVRVRVIPTNEALMMAREARTILIAAP